MLLPASSVIWRVRQQRWIVVRNVRACLRDLFQWVRVVKYCCAKTGWVSLRDAAVWCGVEADPQLLTVTLFRQLTKHCCAVWRLVVDKKLRAV